MRLPRKFGRYELVDRIAVGGTAEIYRAQLTSNDGFRKTVAIKTLLPQWVGNEDLARLLIDEARVLCHLTHQSIVQVLELGEEGGVPFMAMEYVEGIDCARLLNHIIGDEAPLSAGLVLHIIGGVLSALKFAHERKNEHGEPIGIVHRDISPSNILISFDGEVKITDFGIAKGAHRTLLTDAGQMRGKYAYMSPEQARGEAIDCRSDIFSCGVVLCEILFARRLFTGVSDVEVLRAVGEGKFEIPNLSELPSGLASMILLSLAADRGIRYRSASQMLADLRAAMLAQGELSSSADLAGYLAENFITGEESARAKGDDGEVHTRSTRVLPLSGGGHTGHRYRKRCLGFLSLGSRVAAVVLISVGLLATHPARGSAGIMRPQSNDKVEGTIEQVKEPRKGAPARLFVGARPWGLASVKGYVSSRETPLSGLRVRPGRHLVTVSHPPSGARLSRWLEIGEGQIRKCLADFRDAPSMKCM